MDDVDLLKPWRRTFVVKQDAHLISLSPDSPISIEGPIDLLSFFNPKMEFLLLLLSRFD